MTCYRIKMQRIKLFYFPFEAGRLHYMQSNKQEADISLYNDLRNNVGKEKPSRHPF